MLLCLLAVMQMMVWITRMNEVHGLLPLSYLVVFFKQQLKVKTRMERLPLEDFVKRQVTCMNYVSE